jgi:hypothetical protein
VKPPNDAQAAPENDERAVRDSVHAGPVGVRGETRGTSDRPVAPPPPPSRRPSTAPAAAPSAAWASVTALLALAAVPVAPAVAFVATTHILAWASPPVTPPTPPPAPTGTAPEAEPTPSEDEPPAEPPPAVGARHATDEAPVVLGPEATVRAARAGQPLDATWLVPLDCAGLAAAHDAVWARTRPEDPPLDATDRGNLARIRALLDARRCPCPDVGGPCPG